MICVPMMDVLILWILCVFPCLQRKLKELHLCIAVWQIFRYSSYFGYLCDLEKKTSFDLLIRIIVMHLVKCHRIKIFLFLKQYSYSLKIDIEHDKIIEFLSVSAMKNCCAENSFNFLNTNQCMKNTHMRSLHLWMYIYDKDVQSK